MITRAGRRMGDITYQRGSEPVRAQRGSWMPTAATPTDPDRRERAHAGAVVARPEAGVWSDAGGRYALYVSNLKGRGARPLPSRVPVLATSCRAGAQAGTSSLPPRSRGRRPAQRPLRRSRHGSDLRQLTSTDRFEYFVAWNGNDELDFAAAPPFRLWAFDLATGNEEELKTWPTAPLYEGFEDGIRDASLWHQISDPGSAIGAVGGRLVVSIAGDAFPGGPFNQIAAHWGSQCSLPGDFDYQVDYELLTWPQHGGYFAALNAFFGDAAVARMSTPFDPPFDESYGAWRGGADFAFNGINTTDRAGTMRLVRARRDYLRLLPEWRLRLEPDFYGRWRHRRQCCRHGALDAGEPLRSHGRLGRL